MRFGKTLAQSIYPPWKDKYIDYAKLKGMLREGKADDEDATPWTEDDENRFCDEIFNTQLEKVAQFQEETVDGLRQRADAAFEKLRGLAPAGDGDGKDVSEHELKRLEAELDEITNTVKELKKYSNVNYTGFLKIVKKHDRKRGERYRIRPIMQISLSKRPFNSEQGYSPLLNKLSLMYFAVRQQLEGHGIANDHRTADPDSSSEEPHRGEQYTAYKFWVHPDNLIEVKTYILRRLPALVYSQQSAKEVDANQDPAITSLYFDNSKFALYSRKAAREGRRLASSLRLRWYGQLSSRPEIVLEQKIIHENGTSEERKFSIKDKYIKSFLDGKYGMEKSIQKLERQGRSSQEIEAFKSTAGAIQEFIRENKLEPVLRAHYVRSAFQNPGDDRVRIAIDTDVVFVREDTLDRRRPCRDPKDWHRSDIDESNMTYPFRNINQSEVSRFPYAILEIKLKENANRKRPAWVEDLMGSHLVHPAPLFSKFVHGVASLFDDYVNMLPFWLSDLETDIREDPQVAFDREEQRRAQQAENEHVVGSFLGNKVGSFIPSMSSPVAKSYLREGAMRDRRDTEAHILAPAAGSTDRPGQLTSSAPEDGQGGEEHERRDYGTASSVFPSFSLTRYARAKRSREAPLPEGVVEPTEWIKNSGPLQIEPKVWLANERTFLKWQHICVLLGGLAVGLYTAGNGDTLAEVMGITYILIAVFAGVWGYWTLRRRRAMIMQRSGKHFDNFVGPVIITIALLLALLFNLFFAYQEAFGRRAAGDGETLPANSTSYNEELR